MKNNSDFLTNNYQNHFTYNNRPFINPEHGELQPITWGTVIDINLVPSMSPDDDDEAVIAPDYYLQITSSGQIRGVTYSYYDHEEYFSVATDGTDVVFLKLFSHQHPHLTPTLASLQRYRKERAYAWKKQVKKQKQLLLKTQID